MAIEEFFRRVREDGRFPDDVWVREYRTWTGTGPEPMPQCHYEVKYEDDVREEGEHLRRKDATLATLRDFLDFSLDGGSKVLKVRRLIKRVE